MTKPSKEVWLQYWRLFKIGAMLIVPILLLCLPADYFDHSSSKISVFEWLGVSGHYSQGLTRGTMHLIHLDFEGAANYNRLVFVVVPILLFLYVGSLYREVKRYKNTYMNSRQDP